MTISHNVPNFMTNFAEDHKTRLSIFDFNILIVSYNEREKKSYHP